MTVESSRESSALRRTLGFKDLVLLTVGTTIGSGIYLVPSIVLRQTGEQIGPAMSVWVVAGLLSLLGALTHAELGAMKPDAGGLYVFIRDAFGQFPAFLYGWTSFFVIASGSLAALTVAFAGYLAQILPIGAVPARIIAVGMLAFCAAVNVMGTRQSATVQNWTSGAKIGALLLMGGALTLFGQPRQTAVTVWPASLTPSLVSGLGTAMIGVLWAYEGWQYMTYSAGETLDPQRTFPRAITTATVALIVIYLLASFGGWSRTPSGPSAFRAIP